MKRMRPLEASLQNIQCFQSFTASTLNYVAVCLGATADDMTTVNKFIKKAGSIIADS